MDLQRNDTGFGFCVVLVCYIGGEFTIYVVPQMVVLGDDYVMQPVSCAEVGEKSSDLGCAGGLAENFNLWFAVRAKNANPLTAFRNCAAVVLVQRSEIIRQRRIHIALIANYLFAGGVHTAAIINP